MPLNALLTGERQRSPMEHFVGSLIKNIFPKYF